MDSLLLPYLEATEDSERQGYLDELLLVYAGPIIKHILWRQLAFRVSQFGVSPENQDAEDLYQEIVVKILESLQKLRTTRSSRIENFRQYVGGIVTNACRDYVRGKSPERSRLRYKLRELLGRRSEFASWNSGDKLLAGLAAWSGRESLSSRRLAEINEQLHVFHANQIGPREAGQKPLAKLVFDLLEWAGGPIELTALVNLVATLLKVKEHPAESLDDEAKIYLESEVSDTTLMTSARLDFERFLGNLWRAARALPEKQRNTFCFGFEYEKGEDLFTLLFASDIVTLSQLADEFDCSPKELVSLWQKMPMDNSLIAEELGATAQQVRQWRWHAEQHLEKAAIVISKKKPTGRRNSGGKLPS